MCHQMSSVMVFGTADFGHMEAFVLWPDRATLPLVTAMFSLGHKEAIAARSAFVRHINDAQLLREPGPIRDYYEALVEAVLRFR
jgi:hypothetical protein